MVVCLRRTESISTRKRKQLELGTAGRKGEESPVLRKDVGAEAVGSPNHGLQPARFPRG